MIKLAIKDEIGFWGITNAQIVEQLQNIAPGEDIEIEIDSLGGSAYEGISIFNTIREYAKSHPVSVTITGVAASAASFIVIAARTVKPDSVVKISENSLYFIHNPMGYVYGDYREMQKEAGFLERFAAMFASIYSSVSGQPIKNISKAMDDETFYIGQEIVDAGFSNQIEIINTSTAPENKAAMVAKVQMSMIDSQKKIREGEKEDWEKAAAMLQTMSINGITLENNGGSLSAGANQTKPGVQDPAGGKVVKMNAEELKAQHPDCYAAVLALGQNAERERVAAHIKLAKQSQSWDTAAKFIEEGASTLSEAVNAEYMTLAMKAQHATLTTQALHNQQRLADNPGNLNTGDDPADDEKFMAAFESGYYGNGLGRK